MVDLLKKFGTDPKLEETGVRMELGEGAWLLIARMNNPKYQKAMEEAMKPYQEAFAAGGKNTEILKKVLNEAMSKALILDGGGFDYDGKPYKHSPEACLVLISDVRLKDLRDRIVQFSNDQDNYRLKFEEALAKN